MFRFLAVTLATVATASPAFAQAAPQQGPGAFLQFVPIVFAFVVMIIYTNYANKKKQSERDSALSKLERGNEVLTTSGILGRIEGLTDLYITLEIAPGTRIKVLRSAIAGLAKSATEVKA